MSLSRRHLDLPARGRLRSVTMRFSSLAAVLVAVLVAGCSDDPENLLDTLSFSRSPSEDAVVIYVSGAWTEETGQPRELFAVDADGTEVERLTSCTQQSNPCDYLQVAPSSNRDRIVAVRGTIEGDPLATALYFVDLGRSVETIITPARRVQGADWAFDDSFLVYSTGDVENLFGVRPNGDDNETLTQTPDQRERSPRIDRSLRGAAYEEFEQTPGKSGIFVFFFQGGEGGDNPSARFTDGGPGSEVLPGTPYIVGSDASPAFAPDSQQMVFRRLTGTGNGGLGTWDLYLVATQLEADPELLVGGGDVYRGAPDWNPTGIVFVETDSASGESRLVVIQPDGSGRQVLHSEDAGYRMGAPRWLR